MAHVSAFRRLLPSVRSSVAAARFAERLPKSSVLVRPVHRLFSTDGKDAPAPEVKEEKKKLSKMERGVFGPFRMPKNLDYAEAAQFMKDQQRELFTIYEFDNPETASAQLPETLEELVKQPPVGPSDEEMVELLKKPRDPETLRTSDDLKFFSQFVICHVKTWARSAEAFSAGEKKMRFTTLLIGGNRNGMGSFGMGKGSLPAIALQRARKKLKKNLIYVPLMEGRTIPHETEASFHACKVVIRPNRRHQGMKVSKLLALILDLFGIEDCVAKIVGRRTMQAQIYAIYEALSKLRSPRTVAEGRGQTIYQLYDPSCFNYRLRVPNKNEMNAQFAQVGALLDEVAEKSALMRKAIVQSALGSPPLTESITVLPVKPS